MWRGLLYFYEVKSANKCELGTWQNAMFRRWIKLTSSWGFVGKQIFILLFLVWPLREFFQEFFGCFYEIINFNNDTKFTCRNGLSRDKSKGSMRNIWRKRQFASFWLFWLFTIFLLLFIESCFAFFFSNAICKMCLRFLSCFVCVFFLKKRGKSEWIDNNFVPLKALKMT